MREEPFYILHNRTVLNLNQMKIKRELFQKKKSRRVETKINQMKSAND